MTKGHITTPCPEGLVSFPKTLDSEQPEHLQPGLPWLFALNTVDSYESRDRGKKKKKKGGVVYVKPNTILSPQP